MSKYKKILMAGAAFTLSTSLISTGISPAFASPSATIISTTATVTDNINLSTQENHLDEWSEKEINQLANDLEKLFTRYVPMTKTGKFKVNRFYLFIDGKVDKVDEMQELADILNGDITQTNLENRDAGSFAKCVALEGLGIPAAAASPGLINAIKNGIRAWNWGLTAKTVARFLGPQVLKALGGPVGVGVALGWAAYNCKGKL